MAANSHEGPEPTGWELMRMLERIDGRLDGVVTTDVMRLYQEGNDRRHQENEKRQAAWESKSESAHVELDAKIERKVKVVSDKVDALDDKLQERERQDRQLKSGRNLSMALAACAAVVSIIGIVVGAVV